MGADISGRKPQPVNAMPNIMHTTNGESLDLDTPTGQYRYVASELIRHGSGSDYLAALARLHAAAQIHEESSAENQILRNALHESVLVLCFWGGYLQLDPKARREDVARLIDAISKCNQALGKRLAPDAAEPP